MSVEVENLTIKFRLSDKVSVPVRGVSLKVEKGARVAIVGESGSGKSLTALSIGGLIERAEITGRISCDMKLAYVFQNPMASLNPVMKVGRQIMEAASCKETIDELLESVGLPKEASGKYPCELSGGQCQRVMIAMALAQTPDLLIADEPTTALDVTTQKEILELIDVLAKRRSMAVLLITHNLGIVADHCDYVYVMYAGEIVERGKVDRILQRPYHPYTQGLLAAVPRLESPKGAALVDMPGTVPPAWDWPKGCAFAKRCPYSREFGCE